MINEEHYDGFVVALCSHCGGSRKQQIPYKKGNEKYIICPACGNRIEDKDIVKKIEKPIERQVWEGGSVTTESFFDY